MTDDESSAAAERPAKSPGLALRSWRGAGKLARRAKAAGALARDVYRDPRTPWHARAVLWATAAYALSPIDLIPDFIPVIGHLDDLVIVPLGLWLGFKLVPREVLAEHAARRRGREPAR